MVWVKICGVTSVADAVLARDAGADAIGLNFVASSPRAIDLELGRRIRDAVADSLEVVAVVADWEHERLLELRAAVAPDWLQLHGSEATDALAQLLPRAYKVIHVHDRSDVARAEAYAGDRLLVDTKVPGQLGGTGLTFDYALVRELARVRSLILAGGLNPTTVAAAVQLVEPFGVDVASGVEVPGEPRQKDPERVRRFVEAAKQALPATASR
ncbi:MAG TPA: phosphoribosylanthranilate isomerase [Polyangiaceae bacterium]|nr:phosphoribosylanthranilate isomerase [Polyangiaceae bacterium]